MAEPDFTMHSGSNWEEEPFRPHTAPVAAKHDDQGREAPRARQEFAGLGDMQAAGIVLFTTALMVTHGRFPRDPVVEFTRLHPLPAGELPFALDSEYQMFSGLGQTMLNGQLVNWDNRLYGIHSEHWGGLRDLLMSMAWMDNAGQASGTAHYELLIVDPHEIASGYAPNGILPFVPIHVFTAAGSQGIWWLQPAANPPVDRPRVAHRPGAIDLLALKNPHLLPAANAIGLLPDGVGADTPAE